jgi:nucleoside-diphosphate-sugar epimerase
MPRITQLARGHHLQVVEDAAEGLLRLGRLPAAEVARRDPPFEVGVVNLASGVLTSVRRVVEGLASELGIARERLGFGDLPVLAEEMFHREVRIERLQRALGWAPSADLARAFARLRRRIEEGERW